ncbi:hypothetical protein NB719_004318 [Pantoea ananatis]|nr:hypothetical protein [Pantoea ananatis]
MFRSWAAVVFGVMPMLLNTVAADLLPVLALFAAVITGCCAGVSKSTQSPLGCDISIGELLQPERILITRPDKITLFFDICFPFAISPKQPLP